MALQNKLETIKSNLDSLLVYANGITGEEDTKIGDAVRTLADGFGSSNSSGPDLTLIEKGSKIISEEVSDFTVELTSMPDVVLCYLDDSADYSNTPTKMWFLFKAPYELLNKYGNTYPSYNNNFKNNNGYATFGLNISGAQDTNTLQVSPLTTNNFGEGSTTNSQSSTYGMEYCFKVARRATSYPINAGTYYWYTYRYGGKGISTFTGKNARLVDSYTKTITLAETSFVPGETDCIDAEVMLRDYTLDYDDTIRVKYNCNNNDVIVVQKAYIEPIYSNDAEDVAKLVNNAAISVHYFPKKRKLSTTNEYISTRGEAVSISANISEYYDASGVFSRYGASLGILPYFARAYVEGSGDNQYTRCSTPKIAARVRWMFSDENCKKVTDFIIKWKIDTYLCELGTSPQGVLRDELEELIVNGIQ